MKAKKLTLITVPPLQMSPSAVLILLIGRNELGPEPEPEFDKVRQGFPFGGALIIPEIVKLLPKLCGLLKNTVPTTLIFDKLPIL